jgi:hypothetical protein
MASSVAAVPESSPVPVESEESSPASLVAVASVVSVLPASEPGETEASSGTQT